MLFAFGGGDRVVRRKSGEGGKAFVRVKIPPAKEAAVASTKSVTATNKKASSKPASSASATSTPSKSNPAVSDQQAPANPLFTSAEDHTLSTMKAEGKTWAQISEALGGKDRGALKQRYRELMGAKAGAPNEGKKKEEGKGKGKEEDQNGKDGKKGDGKEVGGLSTENLALLDRIHTNADRDKWIEISSRFFDKTGIRVETARLKEVLKDRG